MSDNWKNILLPTLLCIYQFGLIWGIPYLLFFVFLFDIIAPKFGYERITGCNLLVAYITQEYNNNVAFYMEIDKIDFETFEQKVYQRTISSILKMRQIPINFLGFYLWKEVDVKLAREQVKKDDRYFKDEASFLEYFQQIANQRMERTKPLFEFRLVENYTEDTSMIIFRCDHAFCDGISCSGLLSTLNDDQFSIPHKKVIPKFNFFKRLTLAVNTFFGSDDINKQKQAFKTDENTKRVLKKVRNDQIKTGYFVSDIEIPYEAVRKYYKRYEGMTFNDFILAVVGKSLHQYCIAKGIKDPKSTKLTIPIGYKKLPTGYNNLSVDNYFSMIDVELPLTDSVKAAFKAMKPWLSYVLQPEKQKQMINFMHISPLIPRSVMWPQIETSSVGTHFLVSNIPFSDRPYMINGKQVRKLRFFNNIILDTC